MLLFCGCGAAGESQDSTTEAASEESVQTVNDEEDKEMNDLKILVAYFSATGTTKTSGGNHC